MKRQEAKAKSASYNDNTNQYVYTCLVCIVSLSGAAPWGGSCTKKRENITKGTTAASAAQGIVLDTYDRHDIRTLPLSLVARSVRHAPWFPCVGLLQPSQPTPDTPVLPVAHANPAWWPASPPPRLAYKKLSLLC